MPTPLTDADKVIRNDTGKEIAEAIRELAAPEADHVSYDNTSSGLTADNAQDAIDELKTKNDTKMDKANPTGTGSLSLNRKANTTVGEYSAVTGLSNEASGNYTHSEGRDNVSSASFAHSEGRYATASNQYTHAEGYQTTASGAAAHAEGSGTTASGLGSHCEGFQNTASGDRAHAEGSFTIANHRSQHVFGEFNLADTSTAASNTRGTYIEIVGKGSSDANRSNARTLDWSGNETLAGDLAINSNQSLSVVTNAIYSYRFNSSANVEISAFEYSSFIILGYAQGVGSVAILITINNGTIQNIINMKDGNSFSSSDLTFTYANSKLVIASTKAAYSTLTVIKGSP